MFVQNTYAEVGGGKATELLDGHLGVLDLGHELLVRQRGRGVVRPGVHGNLMASTTGTAGNLWVRHHVTTNVEQRGLLVGCVKDVVQLGTERGRAIVVSETPGSDGHKDK